MKRLYGLLILASMLVIGCGPGGPEVPEKGSGVKPSGDANVGHNSMEVEALPSGGE